jgi:carbonic anhydrase/acetyltransferase-like protein (isoleucine patch superfamily)
MKFEANGKAPTVNPSAVVAPTAVLRGDVDVGRDVHVSFGSVVLGEEAPVTIGAGTVIRENVVIRGSSKHPVHIGDSVLIGAHSALYGCTVHDNVFLATGVTVFHGACIEAGAEVRINGVVHVNTRLGSGATVPIGWVAVGDPATVLPPEEHDRIWRIQRDLDFPGTAYGVRRGSGGGLNMSEVTRKAIARAQRGWRLIE